MIIQLSFLLLTLFSVYQAIYNSERFYRLIYIALGLWGFIGSMVTIFLERL